MKKSLFRYTTAVLMASLFLGVMPGTAAAQSIGQLDLLVLLGLKAPPAPVAASAPINVAPAPDSATPAPVALDPSTIPANSGAGRRVVYALGAQRVWLVNDDGSLFGTWLVSGRAGEPNPGNYAVFSRSRHARAQAPGITMEFMVRFARTPGLPIGFHSIPVNRRGTQIQSIEKLGSYQSLGCVRQKYSDAAVMWDFAQIGTPVIVVG